MPDRNPSEYDVAILGAGAAGLMTAIRAAERGRRVLLIEKNRRPGVKILISGGTRCNLTNARGMRNLRMVSGPIDPGYDPREARGSRSIAAAFGDGAEFLGPALRAFSAESTVEFFEGEGLATKIEANGKVFPASDRAADVLAALTGRLGRTSAELRLESPALGIEALGEGFIVRLATGEVRARRVVMAVGGMSYPGCGTVGDGYAIARAFGHRIVPPKPALVPIRVVPDWVPGLRGLTLPDARASVVDGAGRSLLERREAVLFAHFGLSGPAILDVSRAVARREGDERLDLRLDLVPATMPEAIDGQLQAACRSGRGQVVGMLPETIPRRLAEAVLITAGVPSGRIGPELSRDERKRVVGAIKGLTLPIAGTLGFAKAEVTSGGVALDEVDPTTMESRLRPGLHFIGEVLDLDGLIGGYNFQAAWSTGWLAGGCV